MEVTRMQHRLALWADRYLLPGVLTVVLTADTAIGVTWVATEKPAFHSPAFDIAQQVMPMRVYGLILLLTALASAGGFLVKGRSWMTGWIAGPLLGGQWLYWTVMFTLGPLGRHGTTFTAAFFAASFAFIHLLCGLAVASIITPRERDELRALLANDPLPVPRRRATDIPRATSLR